MVGLLSSRGQSRYDFTPNYFCPHIITHGTGILRTSCGEWELSPGNMFTLWSGEHFEYFEKPGALWEFSWLHLEGPGAESFVQSCGFTREIPFLKNPFDPAKVEQIIHGIWQSIATREGASAALSKLYLLPGASMGGSTEKETDGLLEETIKIMEILMHTGININEIADQLGTSRATLFRTFKNRCGSGPSEYFEGLRMAKARELLGNTERSVTAISLAVGFHDARYFARRFREYTGKSPRDFRKSVCKNQPDGNLNKSQKKETA
ncbi:MAG: AraC family transcriptional regulator [Candidatus Izemoplasmatales bacterium]|nr:AraC family transcriptional regulator [Candidatus Izemoplasmatales bacterium]